MTATGSEIARRLPQIRIAGLLGLMAIVSVISSLIGAGAIVGLILAFIWLFPSALGIFLALFTWRSRTQAAGVLTWVVGGLAGLGLVGCVLSMGAGILFWLPLMFAWMPQYALALTYFDSPSGKAFRPEEPLPDDWAEELTTRMDASADELRVSGESVLKLATSAGNCDSIVSPSDAAPSPSR